MIFLIVSNPARVRRVLEAFHLLSMAPLVVLLTVTDVRSRLVTAELR